MGRWLVFMKKRLNLFSKCASKKIIYKRKKIKNLWRFKEKYYCVSESNCLIETKPNGDLSLIQK